MAKEKTPEQRKGFWRAIKELLSLAEEEDCLTDDQLTAIFHILAYGAPTEYMDHRPGIYFGYTGRGWYVEDKA